MKKVHAREPSKNQPLLRFDIILQHDWPIEWCLFHIRVFFGGKKKRPCFNLFIHWLIKETNDHLPKPFFKVIRKLLRRFFFWAVAVDLYGWPLQWKSELRRTSMGEAYRNWTLSMSGDLYQKSMNMLIRQAEVGIILVRDRGEHFKVVGLKNLADARNIKFSVLPFIWHLCAILFTTSANIT